MAESSTERTRPTVLVVDDDPGLADLYTAVLERTYTVRTAYDGQEAIDELSNEVDVVVLDRRMPKLTGDEVLARIREEKRDCQVILVSAVDPDSEPLAVDFDDYITKPVLSTELRERVERLL